MLAGLALGVVAVSSSAILARYAMGDQPALAAAPPGAAPALAVAFWRTAIGAVALAPWAIRAQRRGRALGRLRRRQLAGSGLALAAHFALFTGSLALTTVASSTTLATSSPLFVALGGWWFLRERPVRRTWYGMAVTAVGAVVLGLADAGDLALSGRALVGDVMAFASALAVTGYILVGRLTRQDVAAPTYSATVYAWSAGALLMVCLAAGAPLTGYDGATWLAILGIVIGPQLLGHTVFNTLLSEVPATVVSIVVLAEPVAATLLAWMLFAELPAPLFWVGAPTVLFGVAIASTVRATRPTVEEATDTLA